MNTFSIFKEEIEQLNNFNLSNLLDDLKLQLLKANTIRKNPNRAEGDNMIIRTLKKKIAIIKQILWSRLNER